MKFNFVYGTETLHFEAVNVWKKGDKQRENQVVKEVAQVVDWCVDNLQDCCVTNTIVSRTDFTYNAKGKSKLCEKVSEIRSTLRIEPTNVDDGKAFAQQWWKHQITGEQNYTL